MANELMTNERFMAMIGMDAMKFVTSVDVCLRPGELPVATVQTLLPLMQAERSYRFTLTSIDWPNGFDIDAACEEAMARIRDWIERAAAWHAGEVAESFRPPRGTVRCYTVDGLVRYV